MGKTVTIEFTEAQFNATVDMVDTISAMLGEGGDFSEVNRKNVQLFDRAMKKNGYARRFK